MREKDRNPIASLNKLSQFTTMNVIDGQAVIIIYASLIFYTLTIDNILNIIVLLILAGVAISMLSGENGILNQAASAKTKTDKASIEEAINLGIIESLTDVNHSIENEGELKTNIAKQLGVLEEEVSVEPMDSGYKVTVKDVIKIISDKGTVREENDIEKLQASEEPITEDKLILTDANGHKITIPKNFNISSESPTLVTKGMIIEDGEENQYVWIPVFTIEEYSWGADFSAVKTKEENSSSYYTAIKSALQKYNSSYKSYYIDAWYGDSATYDIYGYYEGEEFKPYTNGNISKIDYNNLYNKMLKNVYVNGGFYIGRYEMGKAVVSNVTEAQAASRTETSIEYKVSEDNLTNEAPSIQGMIAPLSKENTVPYNYITQAQAQMLADTLNVKDDYSNVTSSIMFSEQWNAVCVFMVKFDDRNNANPEEDWVKHYGSTNLWGNTSNSKFKLDRGFFTTQYETATVTWEKNYELEKKSGTKWLCTTGASDRNSSLNIYDFNGNLGEWTFGTMSSTWRAVWRGSSVNSGSGVDKGNNLVVYSKYATLGSRVSLLTN